MKKTKVMLVYLGMSILDVTKTLDTDSFIIHIKNEDFYKDIAGDVEKRVDTSNYD